MPDSLPVSASVTQAAPDGITTDRTCLGTFCRGIVSPAFIAPHLGKFNNPRVGGGRGDGSDKGRPQTIMLPYTSWDSQSNVILMVFGVRGARSETLAAGNLSGTEGWRDEIRAQISDFRVLFTVPLTGLLCEADLSSYSCFKLKINTIFFFI